ncbi:hypothetical protein ADK67_24325 [Saccharothrix sp. NRRL B-16348]|uniref:hypothetical protein n=1 Tax=Saccharothrix sp. NRRL B-16348 TaxID=1415542 RepID=UPI0006AF93B7|nr:hypothetical protein [Saccharothrix sp. NRRL B-16348]KOX22355.1 hypothetical protein ADK67_24325 [Saccharothrix sp. NRRL B-16348]
MDTTKGPGRPQGDLKGATAAANELAVFVRQLTKDQTVRQLAVRYMGGRTAWSLYRSGAQVIPLHLLEQVVKDRVPDQAGRELLLTRARSLHRRAAAERVEERAEPVALPPLSPQPPPGRLGGRFRPWLTHTVAVVSAVAVTLSVTLVATGPESGSAGRSSASDAPRVAAMLALITPSGDAVRSWNPISGWVDIGGPAAEVHGGAAGLFGVAPGVGHIAQYHSPGNWTYIGERGAELAVGRDHLYRLAPDRAAVWAWVEHTNSWLLIGAAARHLYAGRVGMFASGPNGHDLFRYEGSPGNWTWITDTLDPEDTVLVGEESLYRLPADGSAVWEWDFPRATWTRIGGAARSIHVGGAGLFMVDRTGGLHSYQGEPDAWTRIGEGGADIAVGPDRVYRVMPEGAVAQWLPDTSTWEELDGLAGAITATDDR